MLRDNKFARVCFWWYHVFIMCLDAREPLNLFLCVCGLCVSSSTELGKKIIKATKVQVIQMQVSH